MVLNDREIEIPVYKTGFDPLNSYCLHRYSTSDQVVSTLV
jgi:hypothetical protein